MIINLSYDNYTLSNVKAFVTYVDFLNWRKLKIMLYGAMTFTRNSRDVRQFILYNSFSYVVINSIKMGVLQAILGERKY